MSHLPEPARRLSAHVPFSAKMNEIWELSKSSVKVVSGPQGSFKVVSQ